jgi:hypothetical protein
MIDLGVEALMIRLRSCFRVTYDYDVQLSLEVKDIVYTRIQARFVAYRGREMMFTIEFFRNAHAMLDRITHIASDGKHKSESKIAVRHFEPAAKPRRLADFGPGRT